MWYNGGPVAGDSARVLPIGSICKIFVQSSRLSYGFSFSRKFDILVQFYFRTIIDSLHFRVVNKILVAHSEPPALPIGSSFSYQNKREDNKSGDPVNPIGPAIRRLFSGSISS